MRKTAFNISCKLQILLGWKLTTDITLLFVSAIFFALVVGWPVQWNWISKKPSWETMVFYKGLCLEWTAFRQQNTYYLINILFTEGRKDSCYSLPTLGNPSTYFKQGLGYKVLQSIMTWYMTLLSVSYALQEAKKLLT